MLATTSWILLFHEIKLPYRPLVLKQGSKSGVWDTSDQENSRAAAQAGALWGWSLVPGHQVYCCSLSLYTVTVKGRGKGKGV